MLRRWNSIVFGLRNSAAAASRLDAPRATNRDAAAALFLSPKTIEFHLRNIYRKLGIRSRTQLVRAVLGGSEHAGSASITG